MFIRAKFTNENKLFIAKFNKNVYTGELIKCDLIDDVYTPEITNEYILDYSNSGKITFKLKHTNTGEYYPIVLVHPITSDPTVRKQCGNIVNYIKNAVFGTSNTNYSFHNAPVYAFSEFTEINEFNVLENKCLLPYVFRETIEFAINSVPSIPILHKGGGE